MSLDAVQSARARNYTVLVKSTDIRSLVRQSQAARASGFGAGPFP